VALTIPEADTATSAHAAQARFHDFEELTEHIADFDADYMQVGCGRFEARLARVALDRVVLLRCDENAPQYLSSAVDPHGSAGLVMHAGGSGAVWRGERADERTLIGYAPGAEHTGHSSGPNVWISIHYAPLALSRHQRALGLEPRTLPTATLRPPPAALDALRRAAYEIFDVAATAPSALAVPELRASLEEALLGAVVGATHQASTRCATAAVSRERVVRRAFEVLERRAGEPIYVSELCEAADVSERTLRNAFQHLYGVSPIRYLQLRRLALVRRALLGAGADERVSSIAARFGFTNLGRFAGEFRALFGTSPSQLLRARGANRPLHQGFTPS
jgi:AraC-like DNA-binding protein